jgi:hypothetical protein
MLYIISHKVSVPKKQTSHYTWINHIPEKRKTIAVLPIKTLEETPTLSILPGQTMEIGL